ncbi:MAG: hypothetical protein HY903_11285 [Deltaproteobacteria bacterium]|nr:hypothetical protein [Deltaproteobacteria bacterium]
MKSFTWSLGLVLLFAVPTTANAGFIVEGTAGSGAQVKPTPVARIPTNIMIAPGYGFGTLMRAELGLVSSLPDVKNKEFDLEVRPMLVFSPPFIPLYLRAVFAVTNLLHERVIAYGGAIGIDGEVFDTFGLMGEVGVLPRSVDKTMTYIIEGRAGVYLAF